MGRYKRRMAQIGNLGTLHMLVNYIIPSNNSNNHNSNGNSNSNKQQQSPPICWLQSFRPNSLAAWRPRPMVHALLGIWTFRLDSTLAQLGLKRWWHRRPNLLMENQPFGLICLQQTWWFFKVHVPGVILMMLLVFTGGFFALSCPVGSSQAHQPGSSWVQPTQRAEPFAVAWCREKTSRYMASESGCRSIFRFPDLKTNSYPFVSWKNIYVFRQTVPNSLSPGNHRPAWNVWTCRRAVRPKALAVPPSRQCHPARCRPGLCRPRGMKRTATERMFFFFFFFFRRQKVPKEL